MALLMKPARMSARQACGFLTKVIERGMTVTPTPESRLLVAVIVEAFNDSLARHGRDARLFFRDGRMAGYATALGIAPESVQEFVDTLTALVKGRKEMPQ
ncbi:MAG TPA: hypothetical protein PKV98_18900 [Burkholderiaceae bacterium]|nr:hypothetical protein [Burkholderiaceae bacterium]